jgi:hypothetical protein
LYSAASGSANCCSRNLPQLGRAGADDLQPDGLAEVPRRQPAAQRLAQVGDLALVDLEVGVAGDAELRERLHRAAREELAEMAADDAGQQHEALAAAADLGRQADDARQHTRHLDDGDAVLAPEGIGAAEPGDEVQRLVGHQRERVRRVQPHRHQQRPHLLLEEARHPGALRLVALGMVEHEDALLAQRRHQLVVEQRVLLVDQRVRLVGDGVEVGSAALAGLHRLDGVGQPHLEELVEVGRHDGEVAQPLQQRHVARSACASTRRLKPRIDPTLAGGGAFGWQAA